MRLGGLRRIAQTKYYESMDHLNKFLHEKHLHIIDPSLCSQLRMFYRFAHNSSESGHMHEVLGHISPTLRGKVAWRVSAPSRSSRGPHLHTREHVLADILQVGTRIPA